MAIKKRTKGSKKKNKKIIESLYASQKVHKLIKNISLDQQDALISILSMCPPTNSEVKLTRVSNNVSFIQFRILKMFETSTSWEDFMQKISSYV